ncbi:GNAT family N-acetyltransferase [Streptomyces sp. NPDC090108]|uniref:GNAT family N-acetyltransferase n=1 Tax=Streptomyces sp. NPDC090108 TaxID=3365947 RepID=UPI0037FF6CB7
MAETLRDVLDAVARGAFPPADGRTTVVGQACDRDAGVIAFTGHSVVFTDEDPRWVYDTLGALDCDPLAAPLHPRFLTAFLDRTGRRTETVDGLLVAAPLPGRPALTLREIEDTGHPRVAYARRRREEVRVWTADGGVLVTGRGVGGRLEVSVELDEEPEGRGGREEHAGQEEHAGHERGRAGGGPGRPGLGRALVTAARQLVTEPLWAQIAPGNARSARAFQAAGYRQVGAEALLLRATGGGSAGGV